MARSSSASGWDVRKATTGMPAARADSIPGGASSSARQRVGSTPSARAPSRKGSGCGLPLVIESAVIIASGTLSPAPRSRAVDEMLTYSGVGTGKEAAAYLADFQAKTGVQELITVHYADSVANRVRSVEILAEAAGLAAPAAA